jgi:hypothetical protein
MGPSLAIVVLRLDSGWFPVVGMVSLSGGVIGIAELGTGDWVQVAAECCTVLWDPQLAGAA